MNLWFKLAHQLYKMQFTQSIQCKGKREYVLRCTCPSYLHQFQYLFSPFGPLKTSESSDELFYETGHMEEIVDSQMASPVLDRSTDIPWFNGFTVVQWYEAAMCHLPLFQCWWQMLRKTFAVPQLAGWWVLSRACFSGGICCQIIYIPKISIMQYIRLQ